jgi:hypothetical protein
MELHSDTDGACSHRQAPYRLPRRPLSGILACGFALFMVLGLVPGAWAGDTPADGAMDTASSSPMRSHPRQNTFMKRQWGIEIVYVRQTAAGYMLEFRYKVLDAEKAKALFERQTKPVLTHVSSGAKLIVPTPAKTGALRNSNMPIDGHTYWMFFANPGQLVKVGEQVNIEIGDFQAEGLVVQ